MSAVLREELVKINIGEQFRKQSYRNRAYILGPHRVEPITVPVKKHPNNSMMKDIVVDYSENWNVKYWKSISNSYKNSPFFEFYEPFIEKVFTNRYEKLVDLNTDSLTICLKLLKMNKTICQEEFSFFEYKNQFITFNAKNRLENQIISPTKEYHQVFGSKFEGNLSVLDLLFSKGVYSLDYLVEVENV